MSDMILKVTPEELDSKATEFKNVMQQTKTLTDDMMSAVTGLAAVREGEASQAYINKFKQLQTDMDTMGRMIDEHVTNLQNSAKEYTSMESANASEVETLAGNIIS